MNRTPVTSSSLASIGYRPGENTLEVEFTHGAVYQYLDVPETVFEAFMVATSKGSFFNEAIKNRYSFRRVDR
jgi:hypothetical protein